MNIVIPLGGIGQRFVDEGFSTPKPFVQANGKEILRYVIDGLLFHMNEDDSLFVVYNPDLDIESFRDKWYYASSALGSPIRGVLGERGSPIRGVLGERSSPIQWIPLPVNRTRGAVDTVHMGLSSSGLDENKPCLLVDGDTHYRTSPLEIFRGKDTNGILCFFDVDDESMEHGKGLFSYVVTDREGRVTDIAEKVRISDDANTGAYYFRSTRELLHEADLLLKSKSTRELYTSWLIERMIVRGAGPFYKETIERNEVVFLGTPQQVRAFEIFERAPQTAYLFDLDGTLVNTDALYSIVWTTLLEKEVTIDYFNANIQGHADAQVVASHGLNVDDVPSFSRRKDALFREALSANPASLRIIPSCVEYIRSLHRQVTIVTNCNRDAAELIVETIGLRLFVADIVIGSECLRSKPFPDPYLEAMRRRGASPDRTVIFEDSAVGIESAFEAKAFAIVGVNPEGTAAGSDFAIRDYKEMRRIDWKAFDSEEGYHGRLVRRCLDRRFMENEKFIVEPIKAKGGFVSDVYYVKGRIPYVYKCEGFGNDPVAKGMNLYENEMTFYGSIRPLIPAEVIDTPECHGVLKMSSETSGVLLEDVRDRHLEHSIGTDLSLQPDVVVDILDRLALLHSYCFSEGHSPPFTEEGGPGGHSPPWHSPPWHSPPQEAHRSWPQQTRERWPEFEARWRSVIAPDALVEIERAVFEMEATQRALSEGSLCLCHGDVKSANIFLLGPEKKPCFIDWQYIVMGKGVQDVAFFLIESFDEAFATTQWMPLLRRYHERLESLESFEECLSCFRTAVRYFPVYVALWFGTIPTEKLIDPAFPKRFIARLANMLILTAVDH